MNHLVMNVIKFTYYTIINSNIKHGVGLFLISKHKKKRGKLKYIFSFVLGSYFFFLSWRSKPIIYQFSVRMVLPFFTHAQPLLFAVS